MPSYPLPFSVRSSVECVPPEAPLKPLPDVPEDSVATVSDGSEVLPSDSVSGPLLQAVRVTAPIRISEIVLRALFICPSGM